MGLLLTLTLTSIAVPVAYAQEPPVAASATPARVTVAPPEVREVIAEGRAAIMPETGVLGARKAAEAQALRAAVEKALGVFVSARTLTQNYVLVRDQVVTRADGFATLKEVLKEQIGPQEVKVTIRALVSLKPLAEQLKTLGLTRAWRVRIVPERDKTSGEISLAEAVSTLERTLSEAGFAVVSSDKDADLLVRLSPRFTTVAAREVEAGNVPMTMYSMQSEISLRTTRVGTGEVVAALSASDTALHINRGTAGATAASGAIEVLAPRLTDALMVLPGSQSQPVTLVVSNLPRAAQVGKLEDALNNLTGVRGVTRRSWVSGTATWELDMLSDTLPLLTRELEDSSAVRAFGLAVSAETRAKIVATAATGTASGAKSAIRKTRRN